MAFTASRERVQCKHADRQVAGGGQHAKGEAGEEERTGGGAVERGERIGNGRGCLPGAWGLFV